MDKQQVLAKIHKYQATIIEVVETEIICKCSFDHIFIIKNNDDWCVECNEEYIQGHVDFHNVLYENSNCGLQIYSSNLYGIVFMICPNNHMIESSLHDMPQYCSQCVSSEPEHIEWNHFFEDTHESTANASADEIDELAELFGQTTFDDASDFYEYGSDNNEMDNQSDDERYSPFDPEWGIGGNGFEFVDLENSGEPVELKSLREPSPPSPDISSYLSPYLSPYISQPVSSSASKIADKHESFADESKSFSSESEIFEEIIIRPKQPKIYRVDNISFQLPRLYNRKKIMQIIHNELLSR